MEGQFPQANASRLPRRLSMTPALAAFIKQLPGFCKKIPKYEHRLYGCDNLRWESMTVIIDEKTDRKACLHKG